MNLPDLIKSLCCIIWMKGLIDMARKKYYQKSNSAINMSAASRKNAARLAMREAESGKPSNLAELPARGPEGVRNTVIGTLKQKGDGGVVIPDATFKETDFGPVDIARNNLNGAPFDMVVVCEVLNPAAERGSLRGKIVEVLGDMGNSDVRMLAVLRQYGLSQTFPDEVLDEVKDLPTSPSEETVKSELANGRKDLRDLLTITIDGEEAKDLDDAISLDKSKDGLWHLYVHIADVSHYVRENTALGAEAFRRATSVYLVDRVIPMLPPKLSNGLCSLNPNLPRLTLTCEMYLDDNGHCVKSDIYESVIESNMRMSYNECYRILTEPKDSDAADYGPIVPMLSNMKVLAEILKRMRDARGAINFDFPETKVILDDDGNPTDVMAYPINFCHGIIESFMIAANECVAETFCKRGVPFVYRVHEKPDPLKIARFSSVAKTFGTVGLLKRDASPLDVVNYMSTVRDNDALPLLNELLLRSMSKARYDEKNLGHYGLASKYYCHFTSPIRRYPDLYIHRIIKSNLHEENRNGHFGGLVAKAAEQSSEMERNSVSAERASVQIKVCEYMSERIGDSYEGKVSTVLESGFFVMLPNTVEGFVPFRTLKDHYLFDERRYRAVGTRAGKQITVGMPVEIVVENVNKDESKIDFGVTAGFEPSAQKPVSKPGKRKIKTQKKRGKYRR